MKNKRRGLRAKDHQSFVPQSSSTLALAFAPRDFLGERGDLGELPWLPQSPKPPEVLILATGADVGADVVVLCTPIESNPPKLLP